VSGLQVRGLNVDTTSCQPAGAIGATWCRLATVWQTIWSQPRMQRAEFHSGCVELTVYRMFPVHLTVCFLFIMCVAM
jgi:hypothetical protein